MELEGMGWIHVAKDEGESRAVVKVVMKPEGFIKCRELL
jgi:hypothetical protein